MCCIIIHESVSNLEDKSETEERCVFVSSSIFITCVSLVRKSCARGFDEGVRDGTRKADGRVICSSRRYIRILTQNSCITCRTRKSSLLILVSLRFSLRPAPTRTLTTNKYHHTHLVRYRHPRPPRHNPTLLRLRTLHAHPSHQALRRLPRSPQNEEKEEAREATQD